MEIKDMTLTQITLMNLPPRQRTVAEMSISEYEREIKRRLWTRRLKAAGETIGSIIIMAVFVALIAAFIALTPPQMSAEADRAEADLAAAEAAEMEVR